MVVTSAFCNMLTGVTQDRRGSPLTWTVHVPHWATPQPNFVPDKPCTSLKAEAALAHVVGDKVEAAYIRGDLLDKRRKLMDAWAKHCATVGDIGHGDKVVALRA
jgi:hypothetical protein